MYHLRLKGTHYEMGVKRGNIFNKCQIVFPLQLDEFQLKHGIESEKILKEYFPEVCEEIRGITDTIDVDYTIFTSWLLAMGCCMYNIDINHPEVRGCTAFCVKNNNKVYYGRNNDLPPYLKKGSKSEIYNTKNCKFNITTSSFINGEEGVNEYGLVVAMTFVLTDLKNIKPGFNSVFVVRYLLEKAKNTEDAIKLLMVLPLASNMNILLCDKTGHMAVIECSPKEKKIRKAIKSNNLEYVCTVNSFTSPQMRKNECLLEDTYKSDERYGVVIESLQKYDYSNIIEYIKNILKGNYGFMCQYEKKLKFETIWSSIIELDSLKIYRAEGNPRITNYVEDNRMINKHIK